ncbi:MAG TPA: hypothetical protein VJ912_01160 [Candidatus Nanoarchaeia archaeon]|nr:hypothetical protein [Candidatus Nanoarchaeia archaeon]
MEYLYFLTIIGFTIILVISIILIKKRRKIVGFMLPIFYLVSQLIVFLVGYKPNRLANSVLDVSKSVKNNFILGVILFIIILLTLIIINHREMKKEDNN